MKIFSEFKTFAMKGNVVDMAVGIIIGAAFGKIVSSVVNDILMPDIGMLIGGIKFSTLHIVLKEAVGDSPSITINYGNFLQVTFDFLIIAFTVFLIIKAINAAKRKEEEKAVDTTPEPPKQEVLLEEIRDLLRK